MADDEEAVVLACTSLVFCAVDLHQPREQLLEEVRWTTGHVHAVTMPLNTRRGSRDSRDERVARCCPTSATRLVTTIPYAKMHGLDSVS